ncbi:MAG: hypothetical protein KDD52_02055 [Bdellovibrionales bacterium]|nr:hypothetical protein [Bdellovibrionales bacterium]
MGFWVLVLLASCGSNSGYVYLKESEYCTGYNVFTDAALLGHYARKSSEYVSIRKSSLDRFAKDLEIEIHEKDIEDPQNLDLCPRAEYIKNTYNKTQKDSYSDKEFYSSALSFFLAELDIHSYYIGESSKKEYENERDRVAKTAGFIYQFQNHVLSRAHGMTPLTVDFVLENSNSYMKIFSDDRITGLEHQSIEGMESEAFWKKYQSLDRVTFDIVSSLDQSTSTVEIEKEELRLPSAYVRRMNKDSNIVLLRILSFNRYTIEDILSHQDLLEEASAIILDLRGNPGGSVLGMCDVAGLFLEEGPCITLASNMAKIREVDQRSERYNGFLDVIQASMASTEFSLDSSRNEGIFLDAPLVTIVDFGSASASESLAMVLEQYDRTIIVGSVSFGKGISQVVLDMQKYNNLYRGYMAYTSNLVQSHKGKVYQGDTIRRHILFDNLPVEKASKKIEEETGDIVGRREIESTHRGYVIQGKKENLQSKDTQDDPKEIAETMQHFSQNKVKSSLDGFCEDHKLETCYLKWAESVATFLAQKWPSWPHVGGLET